MSNRPHERYAKVYFDVDWLEKHVLEILNVDIDHITTRSEFAKDRLNKGIMFWAVRMYCGWSFIDIANRYFFGQDYVKQLVNQTAANFKNKLVLEVKEMLEEYLPMTKTG